MDSYINKYFFFVVFPAFCIASDGPIKARSTANKGKIALLSITLCKYGRYVVLKIGRLVGTGAGVLYNRFREWIRVLGLFAEGSGFEPYKGHWWC